MNKFVFFILGIFCYPLIAQENIDDILNAELANATEYAMGTFYTTRILNSQSAQIMPKGGLDFRVHHRFDDFNGGYNRFWGMDGSHSYLSLEYGFFDKFMAGFGRQNDGYFNVFGKYALLRQCTGNINMPITLMWHSACGIFSKILDDEERNSDFNARLNFTNQFLIARMFSPKLSLQLTPTFVHRNMVKTKEDNNDLWAVGFGGRYKLLNTLSINAEYFYVIGKNSKYYNPLSIGLDIQVSGHVFQLMVTNTESMIEHSMIGESEGNISKGNLRLGFNISQVFSLGRKK